MNERIQILLLVARGSQHSFNHHEDPGMTILKSPFYRWYRSLILMLSRPCLGPGLFPIPVFTFCWSAPEPTPDLWKAVHFFLALSPLWVWPWPAPWLGVGPASSSLRLPNDSRLWPSAPQPSWFVAESGCFPLS